MRNEPVDHFVPVPLRFFEALTAGDLRAAHVLVGVLIAHRCYEVKNSAAGVATFRLATLAEFCGVKVDTIQRKLEDLQEGGWIEFERPKQGQRIGWRIWLTGLAIDGEAVPTGASLPHHFRTTSAKDPLSVRKSSSAAAQGEVAAIVHSKRDGTSAPLPQADNAKPTNETRRDETRRENPKPLSHGKKDHALGKTTTPEPDDTTDRMLAALTAVEDDGPQVSVEVGEDGELVWHGEPAEGEQGLLEDCEALVKAGLASWVEGPK